MLSLLRLERKQTNSSNRFPIGIFLFLSYSLGIETINTFIHSRSSPENHTRLQTKMGKVYTHFQTKTAQTPHPLGRYIPIWLIQGSAPPPPEGNKENNFTRVLSKSYTPFCPRLSGNKSLIKLKYYSF